MGYIESNLNSNEKVIKSIKHNKLAVLAGAIGSIITCGFGVFLIFITDILAILNNTTVADMLKDTRNQFTYVISIFGGALFILSGLMVFITYISEIRSAQLVLTDKRILGRRGFIAKYTTDIILSKVDTISVNNTFFGAIFGYSTIKILTAGSSSLTRRERQAFTYPYVSNSVEFKKAVLDAVDQAKKAEQEEQAALLANTVGKTPQQ